MLVISEKLVSFIQNLFDISVHQETLLWVSILNVNYLKVGKPYRFRYQLQYTKYNLAHLHRGVSPPNLFC